MRITNRYNLAPPLYEAIQRSVYPPKEGRFSVTELSTPPLIAALRRAHWDEIETDASDFLWRIYGSNAHYIVEHMIGDTSDVITELPLEVDMGGYVVSGRIDLLHFHDGGVTLYDVKMTSVWAAKSTIDGGKQEWAAQMHAYHWMLFRLHKDATPTDIRVLMILRDWRRSEKLRYGRDYPSIPYVEIALPLPYYDVEQDIRLRAKMIIENLEAIERGHTPPHTCTHEHRWTRPETFAVKKKGAKTAVRGGLHPTKESAEDFIRRIGGVKDVTHEIEHRPAEHVRCETCDVRKFCPVMGG